MQKFEREGREEERERGGRDQELACACGKLFVSLSAQTVLTSAVVASRCSLSQMSGDHPTVLKNRLRRRRYCDLCQLVKIDGAQHAKTSGHSVRTLTPDEKQRLVDEYYAEQAGGAEARAAMAANVVQSAEAARASQHSQAEAPLSADAVASVVGTKAAVDARVGIVGKTSTAKAHSVSRKSTQGTADDDRSLHKPVRKRPAAAPTSSRPKESPAVAARPALGQASGVSPAAGTSAAVAGYPVAAKEKRKRPRGQERMDALTAKYPWGRENGPPPANEAEQRSLAEQMARLRIEARNFSRPERADKERLAHAQKMLRIMLKKNVFCAGGAGQCECLRSCGSTRPNHSTSSS